MYPSGRQVREGKIAYHFERSDRTVEDALRRIAGEQIDGAIGKIDDKALSVETCVHEIRKHCKRLRGLVRLVRPSFAGYSQENAFFRDAAKELSLARDAAVLIQTFDSLTETGNGGEMSLAPLRAQLVAQQAAKTKEMRVEELLSEFRSAMVAARQRLDAWHLSAAGFEALSGGLAKTYRQAQKAMTSAGETGCIEAFHDWRKFVKYHWYHSSLLAPTRPAEMEAHRDAADDLGESLGKLHDLDVLRQRLVEDPDGPELAEARRLLDDRIEQGRQAMIAVALPKGAALLAETPEELTSSWQAYWEAWQAE